MTYKLVRSKENETLIVKKGVVGLLRNLLKEFREEKDIVLNVTLLLRNLSRNELGSNQIIQFVGKEQMMALLDHPCAEIQYSICSICCNLTNYGQHFSLIFLLAY